MPREKNKRHTKRYRVLQEVSESDVTILSQDDATPQASKQNASSYHCAIGLSGRMVVISSPASMNQDAHRDSLTTDTSEKQTPRSQHCNARRCSKKVDVAKGKVRQSKRNTSPKNKRKSRKSSEKLTSVNPCCPLCMKTFACPILLPCAHTFCKDCVTVFVETSNGKEFQCPVCSTYVSLTGSDEELFCPNFIVLKNIENEDPMNDVCTVCDLDEKANHFCEECSDLLCVQCTDRHLVVKSTKDHIVKRITADINIADVVKKQYYCTEHEREQLLLHCVQCQQSVCRECALFNHHGDMHNCVPIQESAKLYRELLQRKLYNLKSRTPGLQLALMDVKRVKKVLKEQVRVVRSQISESIKRITQSLKEKERKLYQSVDQAYKQKTKNLNEQKEKILLELEQFEVAGRVLQQLEYHDNNIEMLQMKATIEKSLKNLEKPARKLKIDEDTILLKSNELAIKEAVNKHGELVKCRDERKTSKKELKRRTSVQNNAIIISDFEESSSNCGSQDGNTVRKFRAIANWNRLSERVKEVMKHGMATHSVEDGMATHSVEHGMATHSVECETINEDTSVAVAESSLTSESYLEAKPRLKEALLKIAKNKGEVKCENYKKDTLPEIVAVQESVEEQIVKAKRGRAKANWLLVQSKIYDIVDYGRISGLLSFKRDRGRLRRNRENRTVMKLRHYRAVTLRARNNWNLLVLKMDQWHKCGSNCRKKRVGYKQANKNWSVVRDRLPDVVLFGKYEKYNDISETGKTSAALDDWSRLINSIPFLSNSKRKQGLADWKELAKQSAPRIEEGTRSVSESLCYEGSKHNTFVNRSRSMNNMTTDSLDHWGRLTQGGSPLDVVQANKNWRVLTQTRSPVTVHKPPPVQKSRIPRPGRRRSSNESNNSTVKKNNMGRSKSSDNVQESHKQWNKLIYSGIPVRTKDTKQKNLTASAPNLSNNSLDDDRAFQNWMELMDRRKGDLLTDESDESYANWNKLFGGKKIVKDETQALHHWRHLTARNDNNVLTAKRESEAMEHWNRLIIGDKCKGKATKDWRDDIYNEPSENFDDLINSSTVDTEAFLYWEKLIEGKIIQEKSSTKSKDASKHTEAKQPRTVSPTASHSSVKSKTSVFKALKDKIVSRTSSMKSHNNSGSKSDINVENSVVKDAKESDGRVLTLRVKDSRDVYQEVFVKLSSPDKSILSAHVVENNDGTFTIFCCPRIDNDFNMFVSIHGNQFSKEHQVVNFFGTFAALKKKERDLACKTVSLIRWHLTPGLLTKRGDKVVARMEHKK